MEWLGSLGRMMRTVRDHFQDLEKENNTQCAAPGCHVLSPRHPAPERQGSQVLLLGQQGVDLEMKYMCAVPLSPVCVTVLGEWGRGRERFLRG